MSNTVQNTGQIRSSLARMRTLISHFYADAGGNVAIITGLAAVPLLAAVGCVIDYSMATMIKTKLQAAADAATLATVSSNSPIVASAKSSGNVSAGSAYATNFFNAGASTISSSVATNRTSSANVSMSGSTMTAQLTFSANVATSFMGLMGYSTISVAGASTASYSLPVYIDFYLMLDVSGSMGMPSTAAEQARLQAVNPDNLSLYPTGCTFACHFTAQGGCGQSNQGPIPAVTKPTNPSPGGYCQGFIISRLGTNPVSFASGNNTSNGNSVNWNNAQVSSCPTPGTTSCIQLRLDAVGYAVNSLLTTASNTEANTNTSNEFRVGIYPFIQNLCYTGANNSNSFSVGLTTSLTGSTITTFAAQLANLLDTGQNSTLGSGGTHFENALNTMNQHVIANPAGTGASGSPLPYLFIVTDGSQDYQTQWSGSWSSQNWVSNASVPHQNSATVIPPNSQDSNDYCGTMKSRGVIIAVLYIPYQTIQNANAGFASNEDGYANNNIPHIPAALQACASPNFFYTANTPTDIQTALITMFQQAVSTAHISH
jgi:Flp pilus assembly protein TadG